MVLQITVIEDNKEFTDLHLTRLNTVKKQLSTEINVETYPEFDGTAEEPDIWLLDIDMDISWSDVCGNLHSPFVFVSSDENSVYESLDYHPYAFVRKEHLQEDLIRILRLFLTERKDRLMISFAGRNLTLFMKGILRIYKQRNYLVFVTRYRQYRVRMSFREFADDHWQMIQDNMISVSGSELINPDYVIKADKEELMLADGSVIYPARRIRNDVYNTVLQYLERKQADRMNQAGKSERFISNLDQKE